MVYDVGPSELSLAILYILKLKPYDSLVHFGMCCNSFCGVNRGTSRRFACASTGFLQYASVRLANMLLERTGLFKSLSVSSAYIFMYLNKPCRTTLLIILASCLGLCWTLEQPAGSTLEFYPVWRSMLQQMFQLGGPYCALGLASRIEFG